MKPITGTHVYSLFACERAVALDLSEDRSLRRPLRDDEEMVLARGREHEARIVAELDWPEPEYPPRDFEAGAAATRALLADGVPGVLQGVLLGSDRLGIPDLLRREEGPSAFGDWHYVVGDVKSSSRARGDQVLFRDNLTIAADWLGRYFDPDSGSTKGIGDAITEMLEVDIRPPMPDVSQSLRALQVRQKLMEEVAPSGAQEP